MVASALRGLRYASKLISRVPEALRELERSRHSLDEAREGFENERLRLARARRRLKEQRESLAAQREGLERREEHLKERRRQFKRVVREYLLQTMPEDSVCAEIGVHEGDFSREILDLACPRELHLIDPWEHMEEYESALFGGQAPEGQTSLDERYGEVLERFAEEIESGQVKVHRGYSSSVAGEFEDSYFDWVYVDGNHLYEFVKQDLELYYPKVRPGGYIAGDDYGGKGWWDNGVQKAVDEFVQNRPELRLTVIHKQFIIRLP